MDAALVFPNKFGLDQSLYYIIGNSALRIIGGHLEDPDALMRLKKMRPRPSNYVAWGTLNELKNIYEAAKMNEMIKRDSKWILVNTDLDGADFPAENLQDVANSMTFSQESCCPLLEIKKGTKIIYLMKRSRQYFESKLLHNIKAI